MSSSTSRATSFPNVHLFASCLSNRRNTRQRSPQDPSRQPICWVYGRAAAATPETTDRALDIPLSSGIFDERAAARVQRLRADRLSLAFIFPHPSFRYAFTAPLTPDQTEPNNTIKRMRPLIYPTRASGLKTESIGERTQDTASSQGGVTGRPLLYFSFYSLT